MYWTYPMMCPLTSVIWPFMFLMQPFPCLQRRTPEMDWGRELWALHRRCEGWNLGHGEARRSSQDLAVRSSFLQARRDYRQHAYRCAWLLGPRQQGEPSPGRGRASGRGMSSVLQLPSNRIPCLKSQHSWNCLYRGISHCSLASVLDPSPPVFLKLLL